jgi:regulatory protein
MKIVSIEKAPRGGKFKISFCAEGASASGGDECEEMILSKEVFVDYGLRRNDEISDGTLRKIKDSQLYHDTYLAAMRLLNYRMRTRHELVQRLRQKKFATDVIDRVMDKLASLGLIDDSRFAEAFVSEKISSKPVGKRELERKLREKGISRETASNAILPVSDDSTQFELALEAAKVKLRSLRKFDSDKREEKLIAFLARRGFDWDIIKKVVHRSAAERVHSENGGFDAGDL